MWALLIVTLPTRPNAVRLRIWRNLKALGCAALRDGAYLLPEAGAARFEPIADDVRSHGGTASVLTMAARDAVQQREIEALFDRSADYARWRDAATQLLDELPSLGEADSRRRLRSIGEALAALNRIDHYPGAAAAQAAADLDALRLAVDSRFSAGEPRARPAHGIERLSAAAFRNRRWATRARPWVDRLACAWLIRRFIDNDARILWLADPARAPRGVLGFDYDGARFSHVGALVSVEVLAASFGLDDDARVRRVAGIVHFLDVGGIPVPEACGVEAVLAGLRDIHRDDDDLAQAASAVFDALYADTAPRPPR